MLSCLCQTDMPRLLHLQSIACILAWQDSLFTPMESTLDAQMPSSASSPTKTLVLVGGAWQYPATEDAYGVSIYRDILERAGGVESAKIGIFTTASSSAERAQENGELYVQDFQDLYDLYLKDEYPNAKIDVEWIPFEIENYDQVENDPALIEKIKSYTGFIFGGGDQSLITQAFFNEDSATGTRTETPILQAVRERYEAGAVVAGTSAGTSVQTGSPMITEGESYEALLNGSTSLIGSPPFVKDLYYNPLGGLGFFNYGLLDTHFSERGRQGRIVRLASDVGADLTFGVDENTALIVTQADRADVNLQVLGEGGVFISDLTAASVEQGDGYWSINGVKASYLTEGDQYNPLTKAATFMNKTLVVESGNLVSLPAIANVFSAIDPETGDWTDPREFTQTAISLIESQSVLTVGISEETQPIAYGVELSKTSETQGLSGLDSLGEERLSFANLDVAIAPLYTGRLPGTANEFIDLRPFVTQAVEASFITSSDALFNNLVGLYLVQDEQGTVVDLLTGKSLLPADAGYAAAAVRQSQASGLNFAAQGTAPAVELKGGDIYAPFLIANGTIEQVLNQDTADDPAVFFNFSDANPMGLDHIKPLGLNQFGFEDLVGGGDLDYNDAVLKVNLQVL